MNQPNLKPDPARIIEDNIKLHDAPGYAEFYDENLGLVKNSWERKIISEHLAAIISNLKKDFSAQHITALDIGAGTGNLTLELLKAGIRVTAIDISQAMLARLKHNAKSAQLDEKNNLTTVCQPVDEYLSQLTSSGEKFSLVCACSFYHHLPDYLTTVENASQLVLPAGFFYLTHEPMLKNSITGTSKLMQKVDFKYWRIRVHLARLLGRENNADKYYDPTSQADYWDTTVGCDQYQISRLLENMGFDVNLIEYDSKRSRLLHFICKLLGTKTLFAIIAKNNR